MSWFLTIFFLISLIFSIPSEASHEKQLHPAVVIGKVYCETCFQDGFSKSSHFISGASVAVECKDQTLSKPSFEAQVKTDYQGLFKVQLPFLVSKHVKKIEGCSVKLIRSSEPYCAVASAAVSSSFHLKSRKQGTHIFSAGFFTFKPQNQPNVCSQKPREFSPNEELAFPSPVQEPSLPGVPSLPGLPFLPPLPQLPPLPSLPGLPGLPGMGLPTLPPIPGKVTEPHSNTKSTTSSKTERHLTEEEEKLAHPDFFFPPNPLNPPVLPNPLNPPVLPPNPLNPPSVLPPNPLLPSPPPLIPNPFQPLPAPVIPGLPPLPNMPPLPSLPPLPGLTPPSPPPPSFPTIPPLPFPHLPPLIPGVPPASSSP